MINWHSQIILDRDREAGWLNCFQLYSAWGNRKVCLIWGNLTMSWVEGTTAQRQGRVKITHGTPTKKYVDPSSSFEHATVLNRQLIEIFLGWVFHEHNFHYLWQYVHKKHFNTPKLVWSGNSQNALLIKDVSDRHGIRN